MSVLIKKNLIKYLPLLGSFKRWCAALFYIKLSGRKSYSQHGEDQIIDELLKKNGSISGNYIDVGANHPSSINNTLLFYKQGYNGIIIEPNTSLLNLYKKFRKRDRRFPFGCGDECCVKKFYYSKTPVLSTFIENYEPLEKGTVHEVYKTDYLAVFTLDAILESVKLNEFFLLSIDTEGFNYKVLLGAEETLKKTKVILIEFENDEEKNNITHHLNDRSFELYREISCNLIFVNHSLMHS